jgi:hypothetical protein
LQLFVGGFLVIGYLILARGSTLPKAALPDDAVAEAVALPGRRQIQVIAIRLATAVARPSAPSSPGGGQVIGLSAGQTGDRKSCILWPR